MENLLKSKEKEVYPNQTKKTFDIELEREILHDAALVQSQSMTRIL